MLVGEKIRNLRKTANLTQEKLAKEANIAKTTLWRIEHDTISPSVDQLERLLKVLLITPGQFFLGLDNLAVIDEQLHAAMLRVRESMKVLGIGVPQ